MAAGESVCARKAAGHIATAATSASAALLPALPEKFAKPAMLSSQVANTRLNRPELGSERRATLILQVRQDKGAARSTLASDTAH
ncbi:hypothetical protein TMPK1_09900 [Rhodospirillales bacterium TMPK1]|uniref:Uncharacterized protein n=1 Tax=Roseiterribacter gracilis TaxID=2812848 RepID=A0A8S8X6X9_9PROT|nr:hypothetical protein TMPK1_09900 [Rhodospirillales bacterium TMPK1]